LLPLNSLRTFPATRSEIPHKQDNKSATDVRNCDVGVDNDGADVVVGSGKSLRSVDILRGLERHEAAPHDPALEAMANSDKYLAWLSLVHEPAGS